MMCYLSVKSPKIFCKTRWPIHVKHFALLFFHIPPRSTHHKRSLDPLAPLDKPHRQDYSGVKPSTSNRTAMQRRFVPNRYPLTSTRSVEQETFKEFDAIELYCPECKRAVPVRKRLLLVLPEGDKYEYLCALCSTSVGSKLVRGPGDEGHIII